ncbi:B3 domain-containing protein At3g06220-like [Asparagus officinalis]|uniref:B3 domain-containing protein At3g06220-like n=1 Tax=Asparagus officinalis TaxID=4686 RepID=UPI00098E6CBB|nr:B3 domain-containing protein At3g06220-like [Asparagus officinalis]
MGNPKPNCPSFFKRIPSEFKKHLGESITQRSVVIRNSGGRQWRIKMGIADGHVYFQNGWERFICANSITQGDFLVFFYDGKFGFDVIIYGATCCEKEACVDVPSEKVTIKVESEGSGEEQIVSPNILILSGPLLRTLCLK